MRVLEASSAPVLQELGAQLQELLSLCTTTVHIKTTSDRNACELY